MNTKLRCGQVVSDHPSRGHSRGEASNGAPLTRLAKGSQQMKTAKEVVWECMDSMNWTDRPTPDDAGDGIIKALRQAGYAIVPVEPTEEMLHPDGEENLAYFDFHRNDDAASIYREMIARAPKS